MNYDVVLNKLSKSKFRNSFHLRKYMIEYINKKGIDTVKRHAYDLISIRIKKYNPLKDGKQTPLKGHPVFIAMHACGCCCRGCLKKWYKIPKEKELTDIEINYFVELIIRWIEKEYNKKDFNI